MKPTPDPAHGDPSRPPIIAPPILELQGAFPIEPPEFTEIDAMVRDVEETFVLVPTGC
jgi:hypothetical protein